MYSTCKGRIELEGGAIVIEREGAQISLTILTSNEEGFDRDVAVLKVFDATELGNVADALKRLSEVI